MGIKKIGVDTNYATYEELKQRHVVAQGWSEFGDLTFLLDPHQHNDSCLELEAHTRPQWRAAVGLSNPCCLEA